MKKNNSARINKGRKFSALFRKGKKDPAAPGKRKKFPAISGKRIIILAFLLILALAAAFLTGFIGQQGTSGEKAPEGKETEASQREQNKEETNASDLGELENHLASGFIKILRSEEYLIRYRTTTIYNGEAFEVETTYAVSGDSTALISGDRATVVRDNKVYMLNHADKSMISWEVDRADSLKRIDTEELVYMGSREEGGLICEEYDSPTTRIMFYFKAKELVKMATRINKQDVVMDIVEVSEEVPGNLFTVPSDYRNTSI